MISFVLTYCLKTKNKLLCHNSQSLKIHLSFYFCLVKHLWRKCICLHGNIRYSLYHRRGSASQYDTGLRVETHWSLTLCHVKFSTCNEICMEKCHTLMCAIPRPSVNTVSKHRLLCSYFMLKPRQFSCKILNEQTFLTRFEISRVVSYHMHHLKSRITKNPQIS